MRLYIAEKPSLGRAIADVLPKPHKKAEGCIYVGNGDCVSWCVGHLLEQAEPDAYDPAFKTWQFEHLPIIPAQWLLKPKSATKKQLSVLKKLVGQADELVHAGDPDREGQLLVDQVFEYLKVGVRKRDNIQRCLINDLNAPAVKRALAQLRSNKEFVPLSASALARSRADWLYGINMTRAYTLKGRKVGFNGVLSVGRVQTPLLGLVVKRDETIANFIAKPFYQVLAHVKTNGGELFVAKWQPSEACQPYQDEDGRVVSKALAEKVVGSITDQPAIVIDTHKKAKKQQPPLPYNLSALQIDAAKRFGLSAKQVLDACQVLYERHKLLTYPRSDSRYLPTQHFGDAHKVLNAIKHNSERLSKAITDADSRLKSKAWNDNKVEAHHAIIPTEKQVNLNNLGASEKYIYELVARQYIAQFYPAHEYCDREIKLKIVGGSFIAKSREATISGWKTLYDYKSNILKSSTLKSTEHKPREDQSSSDDLSFNTCLPTVKKGEHLYCSRGELIEKQTSPPKAFDDATLLAAMTGIARYVSDVSLRAILKETDGLGTEATRAGIIELLFKRGFLLRKGRKIYASEVGRGLINSLPNMATEPDMTARWEMELNAISRREATYKSFMQPLELSLKQLIAESQLNDLQRLKNVDVNITPFKKKNYKRSVKAKMSVNTNKNYIKKIKQKSINNA
jgi:DNA topoisomerase-3